MESEPLPNAPNGRNGQSGPSGPSGENGPNDPSAALIPLVQQHLAQELLHRMRELHAQLEFLRLLLRLLSRTQPLPN